MNTLNHRTKNGQKQYPSEMAGMGQARSFNDGALDKGQPTVEMIKADLKAKLARGEISGVEYNQRIIDLVVPKEDDASSKYKSHKKLRPSTLIWLIIILIVSAIPAIVYINWRFYFQNSLNTADLPDYSEGQQSSTYEDPIQISLDGNFVKTGEYRGRPIIIAFRAYYDISGMVASVKDYWGFGAYDALVPRDVCIVWGNTIDHYSSHQYEITQSTRYCEVKAPGMEVDGTDIDYTRTQWGNTAYKIHGFSNNHIISSTSEIRDQIFGLGAGDKVRMIGYLVNASYDGMTLNSSMSRDDSGSHACEVFYVTKLERLQ